MQVPLITVLMPVYNGERFLREAIDSILNQTFRNFEFLIIDDASTDRSKEIILSYKDERIRLVVNESNLGISATLNRGLQLASANLIARMDADDIALPRRLEMQYQMMNAQPMLVLLSSWVHVVDENGAPVRTDRFESQFYYFNMIFICWIYHPSVIFRKKEVLDLGGYTVPYSEDFELFWQIMSRYKIANLSEYLLKYRVTAQSLHQVVRKNEYDEAQRQQVIRNIRYFLGKELEIEDKVLECLRHNLDFVDHHSGISPVIKALKLLKEITIAVCNTKNENLIIADVKQASIYKRDFIIGYCVQRLSRMKALKLMICTRSWKMLKKILIARLYKLRK